MAPSQRRSHLATPYNLVGVLKLSGAGVGVLSSTLEGDMQINRADHGDNWSNDETCFEEISSKRCSENYRIQFQSNLLILNERDLALGRALCHVWEDRNVETCMSLG